MAKRKPLTAADVNVSVVQAGAAAGAGTVTPSIDITVAGAGGGTARGRAEAAAKAAREREALIAIIEQALVSASDKGPVKAAASDECIYKIKEFVSPTAMAAKIRAGRRRLMAALKELASRQRLRQL